MDHTFFLPDRSELYFEFVATFTGGGILLVWTLLTNRIIMESFHRDLK